MKIPEITVTRQENREEYTRQYASRHYYKNMCGSFDKKIKKLLELARNRAKRKGVEFLITADDLYDPVFCPLLPHLVLDYGKRGKGSAANSPSIDRIDSTKGYVPGNVWIISARANRLKSDGTLQELETLVANLRSKMGQ